MAARGASLLPACGIAYRDYGAYLEAMGASAVQRARELGPNQMLEELARSGLRGRGGTGSSTAAKWSTLRPCTAVVCNAVEGEPGSFKDRFLLRKNPYAVLEGTVIAADLLGARDMYVATRRSFHREVERLHQAGREMRAAGAWGLHQLHIIEGPDDYLFGEERALMALVQPNARDAHTLVNNAETLAHVATIARLGAATFREQGTDDTPGTLLLTLSGDVHKPGVYEVPAGITLRQLFTDVGGGPRRGLPFKCALPGVSWSAIPAEKFDITVDFDALNALGSGLGSGGFIVLDAGVSVPRVAQAVARFLLAESCNQCAACRRGLADATSALDHLLAREAPSIADIEAIAAAARSGPRENRCRPAALGSVVVPSLIERFRSEFEAVLGRSPDRADAFALPAMVDFDEDARTFVYAEPRSKRSG